MKKFIAGFLILMLLFPIVCSAGNYIEDQKAAVLAKAKQEQEVQAVWAITGAFIVGVIVGVVASAEVK